MKYFKHNVSVKIINNVLLLSSHESFKNRNKHFLRTVEYVCVVNNVIHEKILCNIPLIAATRNNNKHHKKEQ